MPNRIEEYLNKQKTTTLNKKAEPSKFNLENIAKTAKDIYKYYQVTAPLAFVSALNLPNTIGAELGKYYMGKPEESWEDYRKKFLGIGFKPSDVLSEAKSKAGVVWEALKKTSRGEMTSYGEVFKGAVEKGAGGKLTEAQQKRLNIATPFVGFALDVGLDPLMWLTFGGASALKFGEYGATKAGAKYFANLMKISRAGGMGEEAAYTGARQTMETIIKSGNRELISKLFTKGGIRLAEWIPGVGGESIVEWEKLKPILEPLAKYTGIEKVYSKIKASELKKAIDVALRPSAGVPEQLYEFGRTAMARNQYDIGLKVTDLGNSLRKLGGFTQSEKEEVYRAIAQPEFLKKHPQKYRRQHNSYLMSNIMPIKA